MIHINLLPYREIRRRERRIQFYVVSGLMIALGAAIGLVGHLYMSGRVDYQEGRNEFLRAEIRKLDAEIAEIRRLRAQIDALVARKQVIETLQGDRVQPVYMFNDLVAQLPDAVYFRSLRQSGTRVTLNGHAQSNARVSHLMRSLDASPTMTNPGLVEVKSVSAGGRRLSEFTLNIRLDRPPETEAASDPQKTAAAETN
ncbi:PilN domain-containing protein [Pseudazoarcus pumilus]|uniref:Fimbrial protein n=1 Tax=Pseudazoarcus pumilus TaxID=2067960 RepID=A0A2I6S2T6_9RHOO|nr:PilN domain-containing protein [Pseudazoarcus pumilus]AUN93580.1 fimbrial protein [Pseudazoarcus pumilus]